MEFGKKDGPDKQQTGDTPKEPYTTPQLTVHGSIEKITHGATVGPSETLTSGL